MEKAAGISAAGQWVASKFGASSPPTFFSVAKLRWAEEAAKAGLHVRGGARFNREPLFGGRESRALYAFPRDRHFITARDYFPSLGCGAPDHVKQVRDRDGATPSRVCADFDRDGAGTDSDGASPDRDGASPDRDGASPDSDGAATDSDRASTVTPGASTDSGRAGVDHRGAATVRGGASTGSDGARSDRDGANIGNDGAGTDSDGFVTVGARARPDSDGAGVDSDGASVITVGASVPTHGASKNTSGAAIFGPETIPPPVVTGIVRPGADGNRHGAAIFARRERKSGRLADSPTTGTSRALGNPTVVAYVLGSRGADSCHSSSAAAAWHAPPLGPSPGEDTRALAAARYAHFAFFTASSLSR